MWHIYFLQNKQQAKNKRATLSNIIQQQNITLKKINNMKNIFLLLLFTIVTLIANRNGLFLTPNLIDELE